MKSRITAISGFALLALVTFAWAQDAPPDPTQGDNPPQSTPPAQDPPADGSDGKKTDGEKTDGEAAPVVAPPAQDGTQGGDAKGGDTQDDSQGDATKTDQAAGTQDGNQGDGGQDGAQDENRGGENRGFNRGGFGQRGNFGQRGDGNNEQNNDQQITEKVADGWKFTYMNTPWATVIDKFVKDSGYSFYSGSMPSGSLTYRNDKKAYNLSEYLNFLNSMLLFEDYTLVRHERMLILCRLNELPQQVLNPLPPSALDGEDRIGDYEFATILFDLSRYTAENAQSDVSAILGPGGRATAIPRARQLIVTDMGKKLRMARDMIARVEEPGGLEDLKVFKLKSLSTAEALQIIKPILGIPLDLTASDDGETRITEDIFRRWLIVKASPDVLERIDAILSEIDPDAEDAATTPQEAPLQLRAYATTGVDPAQVLAVVQSLLQGIPGVRAAVDQVSGNLLIHAREPEHKTVSEVLETMVNRAQKTPRVFQLTPSVDPAMAQTMILSLFPATEANRSSIPTVTVDSVNRRLMVMGTAAQLEAADQALKAMSWSRDTTTAGDGPGYIVIQSNAQQANTYLNILGGQVGQDRINVNWPSGGNAARVRQIPRQQNLGPPNFNDAFRQQNSGAPNDATNGAPNQNNGAPNQGGASLNNRTLNRGRPQVQPRQETPVHQQEQKAAPQGRIVSLVPLKGNQREAMADAQPVRLPRGPMGATAVDGGIIIRGSSRDLAKFQNVGGRIFGDDVPPAKDQDENGNDPEQGACGTDDEEQFDTALIDSQDDQNQDAPPANTPPANDAAANQEGASDQDGTAQDDAAKNAAAANNEAAQPATQDTEAQQKPVDLSDLQITVLPDRVIIQSDDPALLARAQEVWDLMGGGSKQDFVIFYLKYTDAVTIADQLNQVLGGGAVPGGSDSSGGNMFGSLLGGALGGGAGDLLGGLMGGGEVSYATSSQVRIVPETRSNALIVQGPPDMLDYIAELLGYLDIETPPSNDIARQPQLIKVYNHSAEEIAQNVREIFAADLVGAGGNSGANSNPQAQFLQAIMQQGGNRGRGGRGGNRGGNNRGGGGGGNNTPNDATKMTISVDAANNALLVAAPQELFTRVEQFVQMLDRNAAANVDTVRVYPTPGINPEWVVDIMQNVMGDRLQSSVSLTRPSTTNNAFGNNRGGNTNNRFGTGNTGRGGGNFNFGGGNTGGFGGFGNTGFTGNRGGGNRGTTNRGGGNRGTGGFGGGNRGGGNRGGGNRGGGNTGFGGGNRGGGGRGGR